MHDSVTLHAGDAVVEVVPRIGGSLASFRWRGVDVLRPAPEDAVASADVRRMASYPLVPYSNRIANATLHLADGTSYALARNLGDHPHAIHGVGWQRPWALEQASNGHCTISLAHRPDGELAAAWPFAFDAMQSFALVAGEHDAALTMSLAIVNASPVAFPFGLGFHPFFSRDGATRLGFRAASMWETDATLLPTREQRGQAPFDPPCTIGDTTLDNAFSGWSGDATLEWPGGARVRIDADRMLDHLVVYIPPDRDFLAVEPVTHMTDAFNRDARGLPHTGTRHLPPGQSRSCTMRIVATLPSG